MSDKTRALRRGMLALGMVVGVSAAFARAQDVDAERQARIATIAGRIQYAPSIDLATLNTRVQPEFVANAATRSFTFDWTSDTVSYLVYAETGGGNLDIRLQPGQPERPLSFGTTASFVFPGADDPVPPGKYSFDLSGSGSDGAQVKSKVRRGGQPTSGLLDFNIFNLQGSGLTGTALSEAMSVVADIFAKGRIGLGNLTVVNVTGGESFLSPSDETALGSLSRQLTVDPPNPNGANLFFVKSFPGLYGFSQGIPVALGISGASAGGVVIVVDTHKTDHGLDSEEMGKTIAHETGHSMGLYHTSERDGSGNDPITDTPRCGGGPPNGCPDGQNIMFWSGSGLDLSAGQAYVLLRSPIVH